MILQQEELVNKLMNSGLLLTKNLHADKIILILLEQSREETKSDLICFYKYNKKKDGSDIYKLVIKKGEYTVPNYISADSEFITFIKECREPVVQTEKKQSPFIDILLNPFMNSAVALPLIINDSLYGIIIVNSSGVNFYNKDKLIFLESLNNLTNSLFNNFTNNKLKK